MTDVLTSAETCYLEHYRCGDLMSLAEYTNSHA